VIKRISDWVIKHKHLIAYSLFPFRPLFENKSDADAEIIIDAAVGINRVVIDLNGAKVDFVVDFYIQTAAERTGDAGIGKSRIVKNRNAGRTISGRAGEIFKPRAIDGDAAEREGERLEPGFRGVVLELHAAQKIVNRTIEVLSKLV